MNRDLAVARGIMAHPAAFTADERAWAKRIASNPLLTYPAFGKLVSEVWEVQERLCSAIDDPMGTGLSQGERAELFYPGAINRMVEVLRRHHVTAAQFDEALRARTSDRWAFFHSFGSVEDFVTDHGRRPDLTDDARHLR